MPVTQRDDVILGLTNDLKQLRAELAATNNRLAWLEGYVEGRDGDYTPEFRDAVAEGLAASRSGDVVSHDVILDDSRARRSTAHAPA